MNQHSIVDYLGYALLRALGPILRIIPKKAVFFLGEILGDLYYLIDIKRKRVAYSNIRTAFSDRYDFREFAKIARDSYRRFFQCLMEVFLIPLIDKEYFDKYITIEGQEHIREGFKKGKGIIFVGVHEGSWELSNIISANAGISFYMFVQEQKFPRMNRLLNGYRMQKGCRLIKRENQLKQLISILKDNQSVGMTVDQGGKAGTQVKFFAKTASMPSGAVRIALKYDAAIIPVYTTRIQGPYLKVIIMPPFEIKKSNDPELDVRDNLQRLVGIFEDSIREYPADYLWTYKIWKYSNERNILILSDDKAGHLRQSQALAKVLQEFFIEKNIAVNLGALEIGFKNKLSRPAILISSFLGSKFSCQGCLRCLKHFLKKSVYDSARKIKPDIIISCGSSLAPVNAILSLENQAKSLVIMRPTGVKTSMFDLAVIPRHDNPRTGRNIAITEGALNLIDEEYLNRQSRALSTNYELRTTSQLVIGLLIGGDTKDFHLDKNMMVKVIKELKSVSSKLNADILVTTSRRTSAEIEEIVAAGFTGHPFTRLLIIANKKNIPEAVGGILGLSQVVLVSAESISMISEAASSNRYVIVLDSQVNSRHRYFLNYMADKSYIYLCGSEGLASLITRLFRDRPGIVILRDKDIVKNSFRTLF
ncbi:MAG: ELM1/GtrOC1 family putative glycosyltransferase [Candidatus Omnitrophota bacterium]